MVGLRMVRPLALPEIDIAGPFSAHQLPIALRARISSPIRMTGNESSNISEIREIDDVRLSRHVAMDNMTLHESPLFLGLKPHGHSTYL